MYCFYVLTFLFNLHSTYLSLLRKHDCYLCQFQGWCKLCDRLGWCVVGVLVLTSEKQLEYRIWQKCSHTAEDAQEKAWLMRSSQAKLKSNSESAFHVFLSKSKIYALPGHMPSSHFGLLRLRELCSQFKRLGFPLRLNVLFTDWKPEMDTELGRPTVV